MFKRNPEHLREKVRASDVKEEVQERWGESKLSGAVG